MSCNAVIGNYNCPQQIGNRLHVMLNADLCAQIYQLPLVWEENVENGRYECDGYLRRASHIRHISQMSSCARTQWPYPFSQWRSYRDHVPAQKKAIHVMRWTSQNAIIYCGRMERPIMTGAMADGPNVPMHIRRRIQTVFENGTMYAYGRAFHRVFSFRFQSQTTPPVTIGMHLRLRIRGLRSQAATYLQAVEQLAIRLSANHTNCTVFIASDSIDVALRHFHRVRRHCHVMHAQRTLASTDRVARKSIDKGHGNYKELFVRELMVLNTVRHMIGTYGSSASELLVEMAAYRGASAWLCKLTQCKPASELIP